MVWLAAVLSYESFHPQQCTLSFNYFKKKIQSCKIDKKNRMFSYFPVVKKQRTFQTYLSGVSIFFIDNIILLNRDYFMHKWHEGA